MEPSVQLSYNVYDAEHSEALFAIQGRCEKFRVRRLDDDCMMLYFVSFADDQCRIPLPPLYSLWRYNEAGTFQRCNPAMDTYYLLRIYDYQLRYNGEVIWSMYDRRIREVELSKDVRAL